MVKSNLKDLIKKYDVPVPRYTSYPTMPMWNVDHFDLERWLISVKRCFDETNEGRGISIYIHLPFCESLCTYCACNTRITKNHHVEEGYLQAVLKEWSMYRNLLGKTPVVRELHLGGGTPTFFTPENLEYLISNILQDVVIHEQPEFSFEGHPNNTTLEHLQRLHQLGFRRVSFGVQDLDPKVQASIHRIQPFENLEAVTRWSRETGYESVSFDLIYGLPYQTPASVQNTIQKVIQLRPDRVSFYSYAHVPWMKPGQRGYEDADLPQDVVKRELYETGRQMFLEAGYYDVGMDHFALSGDQLFQAQRNGTLHRNFMGYTTSQTSLLIGLGVSSISDGKYAYAQNLKKVEEYEQAVMQEQWPVFKGHIQDRDDLFTKECILKIACQGKLPHNMLEQARTDQITDDLRVMEEEGILEVDRKGLRVTPKGKAFVRNVCYVFDKRRAMQRNNGNTPVFSRSI